jgi:hypothetical protein
MYADYDNTIDRLTDIKRVLYFGYEPWHDQLRFIVLLRDGREVEFSILVDPFTYHFSGPYG